MPSRRHQLSPGRSPGPEGRRARVAGDRARPPGGVAGRASPHAADPAVRGFEKRFVGRHRDGPGPAGDFASYVVTPRRTDPHRTVLYLHGGGYVAGIDAFHVRYAPGWPWRSAPGSWCPTTRSRPSTAGATRTTASPISRRGGPRLRRARHRRRLRGRWLRPRPGADPPRPRRAAALPAGAALAVVDLTASAPETAAFSARDPGSDGQARGVAGWWAGSPDDLARPEVSPRSGTCAVCRRR